MKQAKILLLDLTLASSLAIPLQEILESCVGLRARLQHESIAIPEPDFCNALSGIIPSFNPDLIFLVLSSSLLNKASALFQSLRGNPLESPIIVVMEPAEPDDMFKLLNFGASDFIIPPLRAAEILPRVWRLLEPTRRAESLTAALKEKLGLKQLVGESPEFLAEIKKIPLVAQCDASVLISGETGTGKELFARAIHYLSPRASKPFIPVSCGAVPVELLENELFGHYRSAFTGASTSQLGLINEADGETLFLDEIDCLPLLAQAKCLRFLQEKEYRPLGSTKLYKADIRVIAATNVNLEELVREGKLRQDLYYRLDLLPVMLPPLRRRRRDIPLLARHFLAKYASEFKRPVVDFSSEALEKLLRYDWPGNVRQLEHTVQRAILLCEGGVLGADDIVLVLP